MPKETMSDGKSVVPVITNYPTPAVSGSIMVECTDYRSFVQGGDYVASDRKKPEATPLYYAKYTSVNSLLPFDTVWTILKQVLNAQSVSKVSYHIDTALNQFSILYSACPLIVGLVITIYDCSGSNFSEGLCVEFQRCQGSRILFCQLYAEIDVLLSPLGDGVARPGFRAPPPPPPPPLINTPLEQENEKSRKKEAEEHSQYVFSLMRSTRTVLEGICCLVSLDDTVFIHTVRSHCSEVIQLCNMYLHSVDVQLQYSTLGLLCRLVCEPTTLRELRPDDRCELYSLVDHLYQSHGTSDVWTKLMREHISEMLDTTRYSLALSLAVP